MSQGQIVERSITSLKPYAGNARTHSKKQIKQIAASITRFGFTNPVLISDAGEISTGHDRVEAAKSLGWKAVPTLALSHLSETGRRAYVIADNKLALNAGWDRDILAIEFQALIDFDFDVELTGFSLAEIDLVLDEASVREAHAEAKGRKRFRGVVLPTSIPANELPQNREVIYMRKDQKERRSRKPSKA